MMDWYLPGTKAGGPVRSVFSLISLLKNDFDFYVITTNQDLGSAKPYGHIKADTLFSKDNVHYYYFSKPRLSSAGMLEVLRLINPDLIYLNSFWSFNFSINIVNLKNKGLLNAPVLLAPRGMLGKGALGLKSLKKRVFLFAAKNLGWYKRIVFQATQQQEASDTRSKFRSADIRIAPNINAAAAVANKSVKHQGYVKLFFLSRVSRVKNLHFALEILKSIPQPYTVEYTIFGNLESQDYWSDCEKIIATLPKNITVTYKGELQFNEVQSTICHFHFLFLPTLNENFGHSIVESLLCGCPAIISDQTPWNDLEKNNAGYAIALSDTQKYIDAIVAAARLDQDSFLKKSSDTISYIQNKIDLQLVINQYKNIFNDIIKN